MFVEVVVVVVTSKYHYIQSHDIAYFILMVCIYLYNFHFNFGLLEWDVYAMLSLHLKRKHCNLVVYICIATHNFIPCATYMPMLVIVSTMYLKCSKSLNRKEENTTNIRNGLKHISLNNYKVYFFIY